MSKLLAVLNERRRPRKKTITQTTATLTEEEIKRIFRELPDAQSRMLFWTLFSFGTSVRETVHLHFSDVELDLENPRLIVEQSGGSEKKTRYIPLFSEQVEQWRNWLDYRTSLNLPHNFLFFDPKNPSKMLTRSAFWHLLSKISKTTGISFSANNLRYTYAVRLRNSGVDIYTINRLLGQSSIKTTIRYLRVPKRELRQKFMESAAKRFFHWLGNRF
jgi:site-specific recombinase XerD